MQEGYDFRSLLVTTLPQCSHYRQEEQVPRTLTRWRHRQYQGAKKSTQRHLPALLDKTNNNSDPSPATRGERSPGGGPSKVAAIPTDKKTGGARRTRRRSEQQLSAELARAALYRREECNNVPDHLALEPRKGAAVWRNRKEVTGVAQKKNI